MTPGTLRLRHLEHPRQPWVVHASGTLPRGAACGGDGAWGGCPALASDRGQCALASAPSWTPAPRGLGAGQDRGPPTRIGVPPPPAGSARRGGQGSGTPRPRSRTARWLFVGASSRRPTRPDARAASGSSPPRGACVAHQQRFHSENQRNQDTHAKRPSGSVQRRGRARRRSPRGAGAGGPPHRLGRVPPRLWPGVGGRGPGTTSGAQPRVPEGGWRLRERRGVGLGSLEGGWGDSKRGAASGEGGPQPGRRSLRGGVAATAGVWGIWGPRARGRTGAGRRAGGNRGLRIGKALLSATIDNRRTIAGHGR